MEIEAKFAITGPLDSAALAAVDLGPYRLAAPRQQIYRDLLLDTPGRVITGSGHALRLRFVEDGAILTEGNPPQASGLQPRWSGGLLAGFSQRVDVLVHLCYPLSVAPSV